MIKNYIKGISLLTSLEKRKSILFIFFLLIASFLEILGIGLILPLLEIMTNDGDIELLKKYNIEKNKSLINITLSFFVSVFIIKNIFILFFTYWQKKFSMSIYRSVARRVLTKYMYEEFVLFKLKNSSEFITKIIIVSKRFSAFVMNIFKIVAEITIGVSIVLFLAYHNLKITLISLIIIGLVGFLYILIFKRISYDTGKDLEIYSEKQVKTLQEIFGGLKDIKIKNLEEKFINFFQDITYKMTRTHYIQGTVAEIPKIWLEIIFVILFASILFFYNFTGSKIEENIPTLGLFALASFRLIPCANRIVSTYQNNIHNLPSIEKLELDLANKIVKPLETFDKKTSIEFNKDIKAENISFIYPGTTKYVFKNFSCSIRKNTFTLIRGKSGSGKSTLIDLIMGINKPLEGKITSDGYDINESTRNWQQKISYLSQSVFLMDDTVKNNITFESENNKGNENFLNLIVKQAALDKFILNLNKGLDTMVGEKGIRISGGQIQRIGIARELYRQSEILIFDESTSALDKQSESEIVNCLKNLSKSKTIIFISHKEDLKKIADNVIDLDLND